MIYLWAIEFPYSKYNIPERENQHSTIQKFLKYSRTGKKQIFSAFRHLVISPQKKYLIVDLTNGSCNSVATNSCLAIRAFIKWAVLTSIPNYPISYTNMQKYTYTLINKETPLCDFIIEGEGELEFCEIVKTYAPPTILVRKYWFVGSEQKCCKTP